MDLTRDLLIGCAAVGNGWQCRVTIGQDDARTVHDVSVTHADIERFAPGATEPASLVRESFEFLLEREPREAILRRFELSAIERYFPGYSTQIGQRMRHGSGP